MEGLGIYTWHDGRIYEGEYKDDKKHGYGIYQWADGRKYMGYWNKGKQNGLGVYIVGKDDKVKYGIWEEGKRIKWLDPETEVALINNREMDYQ